MEKILKLNLKYNIYDKNCFFFMILQKWSKNVDIYEFLLLNKLLTTTDLAYLESATSGISRALQYWNIAFKRP